MKARYSLHHNIRSVKRWRAASKRKKFYTKARQFTRSDAHKHNWTTVDPMHPLKSGMWMPSDLICPLRDCHKECFATSSGLFQICRHGHYMRTGGSRTAISSHNYFGPVKLKNHGIMSVRKLND